MMKEGHTASEIGHILVEGGCGAASMKGGLSGLKKAKETLDCLRELSNSL